MPTTNPVPSTDPSDLLFNAGKLDEVVNGTANSFTDRLGVARRTVAGMNADFDAQLADAESDLNVYRADAAASAAEALGYLQTIRTTSYGAYASDPATDPLGNPPTVGDEYFNTTANLLKRWNGTTWQASDINTANLAASSGSSLVGYDGGTVQDVLDGAKSLQDYAALRAYSGRATRIYITGLLVTAKPAGIAGFFQYDPTDTASSDNGGTIIVGADGRRWKRDFSGAVNVKWFGAKGDWNGTTGTDDTTAIQSAIVYCANSDIALYIPGGAYRITASLLITKKVTIFGDGRMTVIQHDGPSGVPAISMVSPEFVLASWLDISKLRIVSNTRKTIGVLQTRIVSSNFYDIHVENFDTGWHVLGTTNDVVSRPYDSGWNNHYRRVFISLAQTCMRLDAKFSDSHLVECGFQNFTNTAVLFTTQAEGTWNTSIERNLFGNNDPDIGTGISFEGICRNISIIGNTIENIIYGIKNTAYAGAGLMSFRIGSNLMLDNTIGIDIKQATVDISLNNFFSVSATATADINLGTLVTGLVVSNVAHNRNIIVNPSNTVLSLSYAYVAGQDGYKTNRAFAVESRDFICMDSTRGVVLRSPDQSYWRIKVGDAGTLTTTKLV